MTVPIDGMTLLERVAALGLDERGRSFEGRPISGGRFGPADVGVGALLVFGGIHGDEPSSVEACVDLAHRLASNPRLRAPIWLVPATNPDGLVALRKNSARNVDLNRNFPARSFTTDHVPGYSPGPAPLSEPETRLLAELIDREGVTGVVAVHSPLACINYDGPAAAWADRVAAACGWPARGDIGYPTPGSLGGWLGRDRGLPVLTVELPPGPLGGFRAQAAAALEAAVAFFPTP